jgi:hypothetical protein
MSAARRQTAAVRQDSSIFVTCLQQSSAHHLANYFHLKVARSADWPDSAVGGLAERRA